jgi:hypothetical protein
MSEFLTRFHESLEAYVWGSPDDPRVMQAAHPDWDVNLERLAIYGEFIPYYLQDTLDALFSATKSLISDEAWGALSKRYYALRTSRHYEINHLAHEFPEWLRTQPEGSEMAADVALFELTRHQVFTGRAEVPAEVEALSVNPTLTTLQLGHRVSFWEKLRSEADEHAALPASPEVGEELVLLWRHPKTFLSNYWTAKPRTLLALKIVLEAIPLEEAAAAGGVEPDEIRTVIDEAVEHGLLLRP